MLFSGLHHVAIICSNYELSKKFYTEILGFEIIQEVYRAERKSYKVDLMMPGKVQIELFSFESPPKRLTHPEACGLRHLAFKVDNIASVSKYLETKGVKCEPIRIDESTGKEYTFFRDPDDLPLEIYAI